MVPAQILDITNENNDKYTHKKFQGNYAHKKFGTRLSKTPAATEGNNTTLAPSPQEYEEPTIIKTTNNTKTSFADIFRPYALPDNTNRKRKRHELQTELNEDCPMDVKRFAASFPVTPLPSLTPPAAGAVPPILPFTGHFMQPSPMMFNFCYHQQYQFNSQMFALILQKQSVALSIGEIWKRQANLNLYNLMGQ